MQQRNKLNKYVLDIESVLNELDQILALHKSDYLSFSSDFIAVRAVERDFIIIGEAVGKMIKLDESINISGAKDIIGLRNLLVHAYDSIDASVLWKILIKDLPILKEEIANFRLN